MPYILFPGHPATTVTEMPNVNRPQLQQLHQLRQRILRTFNHLLWGRPLASLPFWQRALVRSGQILYAILRDWAEGQLSLRAMSLVYSTVLGFIPMVALVFAVLKSFGVHNAMEPTLYTLLEALGDRRDQVISQIIAFVDNINVEIIGITSLGLLVYLVLDMMRKIEISFNYIWNVSRGRSWSSRVSEYLFAIIVSPVLLFISISITTSVNTNFFVRFLENLAWGGAVIAFIAFLLPLLFMSLAFAFAYSFLPNTRVNFSSAFIGGLVTTIVWKLMGAFFQGFLITAARESIYLAFASVIAVMILTYIGWLVALLGSDIAYYHQHPGKCRNGRRADRLGIRQQEHLALTVAMVIIRRFEAGGPPLSVDDLAQHLGSGAAQLETALQSLQAIGLLVTSGDEPVKYLPATAVRDLPMVQVWQALRDLRDTQVKSRQPTEERPVPEESPSAEARAVTEFLQRVDQATINQLGRERFVPVTRETSQDQP
ncbi:MAG: hypothetical protein RLZZ385_1890 [Pseudomonadota bacterium]|jgi:membrane protein